MSWFWCQLIWALSWLFVIMVGFSIVEIFRLHSSNPISASGVTRILRPDSKNKIIQDVIPDFGNAGQTGFFSTSQNQLLTGQNYVIGCQSHHRTYPASWMSKSSCRWMYFRCRPTHSLSALQPFIPLEFATLIPYVNGQTGHGLNWPNDYSFVSSLGDQ